MPGDGGLPDWRDLPDEVRASRPTPVEILRFLPDVGRLLWSVARDARVPWYAKAAAGGAAAYVVSPIDIVPDFLPVFGQMDDVWVVVRALKFLLRETGQDLLEELWTGTDEGFGVLLWLAGVRD